MVRTDPASHAQGRQRGREEKEKERFSKLKAALMNYDFQTGPRIKKESFRDLVVDDIDVLRIALIGTSGSGRTSFVGKNSSLKIACSDVNHIFSYSRQFKWLAKVTVIGGYTVY